MKFCYLKIFVLSKSLICMHFYSCNYNFIHASAPTCFLSGYFIDLTAKSFLNSERKILLFARRNRGPSGQTNLIHLGIYLTRIGGQALSELRVYKARVRILAISYHDFQTFVGWLLVTFILYTKTIFIVH